MWYMKLPWEILDGMLERLTVRMKGGEIDGYTYIEEFNRVLEFARWTEDQLKDEIDRRWTLRRRCAQVFEC